MPMKQEQTGKTILIADDDESIRLLVRKLLSHKFIVIEARDGRTAVNMIYANRPDLVLMDIMMPNMDGYTACSIIKNDESVRAIPVIFLSGVAHELNKKLAEETGAEGDLTKPFTLAELRRAVNETLKSHK